VHTTCTMAVPVDRGTTMSGIALHFTIYSSYYCSFLLAWFRSFGWSPDRRRPPGRPFSRGGQTFSKQSQKLKWQLKSAAKANHWIGFKLLSWLGWWSGNPPVVPQWLCRTVKTKIRMDSTNVLQKARRLKKRDNIGPLRHNWTLDIS